MVHRLRDLKPFNLFTLLFFLLPIHYLLFSALAGCKNKTENATLTSPSMFSEHALSARFYYDLGPATVEVSEYPEKIKQGYRLFLAICTECHTSARPLNAPYIKADEWKRYVKRMRVKMQRQGMALDPKQEKQIIEFLVYDSKIRKIDGKKEFNLQQENLKKLFEEVSQLREKMVLEKTLKLPKKEMVYVGIK